MKKETKDKHFIKKPEYVGGAKAMKQFIKENLKYPKEALKNKIEGTVSIDYKVDNQGKVMSAKVISGLGYGCDEEALRLVKSLKFSTARNRKMRVTFNKKIQIHFRLPKEKPSAKPVQSPSQPQYTGIQYQYIPKKKKKQTAKKKGKSYTITYNF